MRILHVISTLAPASGGTTEVVRSLASAQAEAGHQVTVCTTDRSNPVKETLPECYFQGLYPAQIALNVFPVLYAPLLLSLSLSKWLRGNIRAFDIIHIHGLYRFPPSYAAYQARKQGLPYIIQPHGSLDPYLYDKSSRSIWLKRIYERWFDLPNLNAADAVHFTAEDERDRVSFLELKSESFVVPNGLDWARYRTLPSRGSMRERLGVGDAPVVLFLGRIHFKKGLDILIPAFAALRRRLPSAKLVIAGPETDDYSLKVREWVCERGLEGEVHFVGALSGPEVVQAYVDSDVFALPSYTENFGMTVAEAMACDLPVVISDQVNIHEEVERAGAGLVTRCDIDEVASALEKLLMDHERRKVMGNAGRKLVQERYSWQVIVDSLTDEYKTVIERHRRSNNADQTM